MFLNLFLMLVMVCVITIPYLTLGTKPFQETINATQSDYHGQALNCSEEYNSYSEELFSQESTFEKVLDFLQGTVSSISFFILNYILQSKIFLDILKSQV